MINNPVYVKKSEGGKMPEWEVLEFGASQDVPMPLAGAVESTMSLEFELNFEQLPRIILFRTPYHGEYQYSALYLEDGELLPVMTSHSDVGVKAASIAGETIAGSFHLQATNDTWFRPVYV